MGYYTDYLIKAKGNYAEITELFNFLLNQLIHSDDLTEEEKEKWDKRDKAFPFSCTFPYGQVKDEKIYHGTISNETIGVYRLAMVMSFKYIWNFGIVLYIQDYLKRMDNNAEAVKQQVDGYENSLDYPDNWEYTDNLIISGYFTPHPDWFYLTAKRSKLIAAHLADHYGEELFRNTQPYTPWLRDFF